MQVFEDLIPRSDFQLIRVLVIFPVWDRQRHLLS